MSFIIAQILGLVATVTSMSVYQFKNEKIILMGQFLTNLLMAINFGLLGGLSGAWICMVAAVETILIYVVNKKCNEKKKLIKNIIVIVFVAIYIVGTIITFKSWPDIMVCVCAMLYTASIVQENSGKIRKVMFFNASLWIIYDITIGAWTGIITHGLTLASIVTGMIRLDRKKSSVVMESDLANEKSVLTGAELPDEKEA